MSTATLVSERYAQALFELARDAGALAPISADMQSLRAFAAEKGPFSAMLRNPLLTRAQGKAAADAILEKANAHILTRNLFGVLAQNRRLDAAGEIAARFLALAADARGEVTAEVTAANDLSDAEKTRLAEALSKKLGKKVAIDAKTDARLLGGLTIRAQGKTMDYSIRGRLDRLAQALKSAPLGETV